MELEIFEYINEVLEEYQSQKEIYKLIAEEVKDVFEKNVFSESKYEFSMTYRIKSASSIREKLIRNNYEMLSGSHQKLLSRMQDIIGLRIECKFMEVEQHAYALLRQLFNKTDDKVYYYMSSMPRIRLKLSEKQPQLQKNGFEIYKIDGYFSMGKEQVSFELQIKALANAFWGEIEHRVVYKNRDYMLSDTFVSDLFKSIKESLNTLDSQLHLLYQRFHQEPAIQEEAVVERKRERSVEIFIADMVYATFDQIILEQLGFSIDFKQSCDAIVRYLIEREHADDMEDYGRMMMIIFNLLDQAEERLQLVEQITFRRKVNYPDAFTAHLGNLIETLINRNFRWHLYFAILFAMEDKPREQVMEEFVVFYKSSILENRSLIAFEEIDSQQEKEIFDVLLEEVGKQLEMTQKVEYLCADGLKQIHRGFNYILPIIRSEISNGIGWQEIRQTHIEKFVDKIKI